MKNVMVFLLMLTGMVMIPLASQAQDPEPENEMKMDFNPEMFKMNQGTGRTSITPYWGFGPTLVTSNIEVVGYQYPEFKPFSSWSNDLGVMLRTRLGGATSKFHLFYGVLWRYINVETDNLVLDLDDEMPIYFEPIPKANNTELNIHTLSVPLLLEYKGKVSFAVGGFAAYRLCSSSEYDFEQDGNDNSTSLKADFGLNDLLYGVTGQIGVKRARVYVNYYLNNLFADDSPYDFTVMNIGIAFM